MRETGGYAHPVMQAEKLFAEKPKDVIGS